MEVTLQVVPLRTAAAGIFESLQHNERVQVQSRAFHVRVIVHNAGDGVFRWGMLNIQVPVTYADHHR